MVVSSGFLGHVLVSDRSEDFLRSNGLITAAQPLNNTLNRQQQVTKYETLDLKTIPIECSHNQFFKKKSK